MTVNSPEPLPEWASRVLRENGSFTEEFYRYLLSTDLVARAVVDFVNIPPAPDPEYELIEEWPVFIAFPSNKDYRLVLDAEVEREIFEVTTRSASGTCTATVKIDTTALGGSANSVSSSEQSQAHASANTWAVGSDLVLTVSANAACVDMSMTVRTRRTLTT